MEYDQRVIVWFLSNEGIADDEIISRLQAQFAEHAYKFRTVWFWIGEVWFGRHDLHDEICTGRPPLDDVDAKILAFLNKSPFESARSIAERLRVSHAIMLDYLHLSIDFKWFHLSWVPHLLTEDLRQKRKDNARAIFPLLHAAQRDIWHHIVTSDESWFFFDTLPRRMWTLSRDDMATKPRQQIQSKKFMFLIICNPTGFYVVDRLPNDTKMNSAYFVTNILTPLEEVIFPQGRALHQNDLSIISTIAQFTRVGLQQNGSKNMACVAWVACVACHSHSQSQSHSHSHSHPIRLIWPPVTSTCFLQWKRNSNGLRSLTKTSFWIPISDFEGYRSGRIE
jgi:hypothetical protein